MPSLIGITGRARSGKDTVADFIVSRIEGYKYSFAEPLKRMLLPLGIDMSLIYWQSNKDTVIPIFNASPRRLMQTLGTEWGRQLIHPDIWLILANRKLSECARNMVIADVRFENEAAWVRKQGGTVIHVLRKSAVPVEQHVSEAGINVEVGDYWINNDGTLEELEIEVIQLLHKVSYGK